MSARSKSTRHTRILDIRAMIGRGKSMAELKEHCIHNLKVSTITANSYIDEAAEPYRKKYQQENPEE